MDIYLLCSNNFTEEHETASEKPDSTHSRTLITKALVFLHSRKNVRKCCIEERGLLPLSYRDTLAKSTVLVTECHIHK